MKTLPVKNYTPLSTLNQALPTDGSAILHLPARFIAEDEYQKRFPAFMRKAPERKP
jgi:rRNA maturation protein Nop10